MVTLWYRPQLGKSRERRLNSTFESRHWSAGIKTVLRAVRQYVQKSCRPGQPETRWMRRLMARVSQLPLQLKLISCWQFRVFQTLPVSSLFSDGSCCMARSGQVWIGHCGADCDIPSQWFTSAPRNEGASVWVFAILVSRTSWLLLYWNAHCIKGATDTLV